MPDFGTTLPDGKTATSKDGQRRMIVSGGTWVNDPTYRPPAQPGKTSPQDRTALNAASAKAASERDAQRTYDAASRAVDDMGTGPGKAKWLDAIMPDESTNSGWSAVPDMLSDGLGVILGTPFRALTNQKTLDARDHLKTVSANVALAGSQQMKGSSSDKDTALMRMSGLSTYKGIKEN